MFASLCCPELSPQIVGGPPHPAFPPPVTANESVKQRPDKLADWADGAGMKRRNMLQTVS